MYGEVISLFERAIDPNQYDSFSSSWLKNEGKLNKEGTRNLFYKYFKKNSKLWHNSDILDLGCGSGWLSYEIYKNKPKSIVGIDPSIKNISYAKNNFVGPIFIHNSFEKIKNKKYDLVVCNMVFEHLKDIDASLKKVKSLLKSNSEFHLVIGNYEYMNTPRKNYEIKIETLNENSYVVETKRNEGLITDIIRKHEYVIERAIKLRFNLISLNPIYTEYSNIPIAYFLKFT